jgi:GntR family transcriptional regulator
MAMVPRSSQTLLIAPLSAAAPGPLYQQIIDSLKREISEGRLAAGAPLPSFRGLAEDLLVSVITVKRAYEELEREGIIYRRQGLGTFVSEAAPDLNRVAKTERARELFEEGLKEAAEAGLDGRAVLKLVQSLIREGAATHVRKRA